MSRVPGPGNLFIASLSDADRSYTEPYLQTTAMHAGQCLQRAGDEQEHVILPHSGAVVLGLPSPRGGVTEGAIVGRESILGGLAAAASVPALYSCQVRVPGRMSRISRSAFRSALERSAPMRELAARCDAALLAQVQQSAHCSALHSVEARLCRWLLQLHDRSQSDRLPLTQDLLAQALGVRRTTITLVAGKLQEAGAINWRRGYVQIAKREHLEHHVCGCYACSKKHADIVGPVLRQDDSLVQMPRENGHALTQLSLQPS